MLVSPQNNIKPPEMDDESLDRENEMNDDLDDGQNPDIYNRPNVDIKDGGVNDKHIEESNDQVNDLKRHIRPPSVNSNSSIRIRQNKVASLIKPKKSPQSKLSALSKNNRTRMISGRTGRKTATSDADKTGAIGIAMQVLNMNEDEKE
jgi:hypothetical protein